MGLGGSGLRRLRIPAENHASWGSMGPAERVCDTAIPGLDDAPAAGRARAPSALS
jgi:hypothetical protein